MIYLYLFLSNIKFHSLPIKKKKSVHDDFKDVIDKIFKMASEPSAHLQRPQGKVMLNTTLRNFITYNVIIQFYP